MTGDASQSRLSLLHVSVEDAAEETLIGIGEGLRAHNIMFGGAPSSPDTFVVTLRDENQALVGGITCDLYLGGLLIEWAWIADQHRGKGFGQRLLAAAEAHAIGKGAQMAHLDTFTFQARGFYERCGYKVFGVLAYPDNIERFYMAKQLFPEPKQ